MNTFFDDVMFKIGGLQKLNSLTKYPSVLTYHNLGPKNSLVDSLVEDKNFGDQTVYITEKIDGVNSRVIISTDGSGCVDDYIIGSREELLYAKGDRIVTDHMGVVENMRQVADIVTLFGSGHLEPYSIYCLYGETYGGRINNHKQYSGYNHFDIRIFDMFRMDKKDVEVMIEYLDANDISIWRDEGKQPFVAVDELKRFCNTFFLKMVPYLKTIPGSEIPNSLQDVWDWMRPFQKTVAKIDNSGLGMSEGLVVRTADRSMIRKIRFEDYEKTKRRGLIK